jgi:hypothetical protein
MGGVAADRLGVGEILGAADRYRPKLVRLASAFMF